MTFSGTIFPTVFICKRKSEPCSETNLLFSTTKENGAGGEKRSLYRTTRFILSDNKLELPLSIKKAMKTIGTIAQGKYFLFDLKFTALLNGMGCNDLAFCSIEASNNSDF
ncbi:hypothetical protein GCM10011343_10700 [Flavobacterium orientale]|uniref:Uncharacterized protein n=1 Tax=Flavobacterium orientale TaxID=1756020 RepID=A0A916XYW9_9FLAO|nr:hypothetical protein GCM10011343_10700 [Flavobacterium orientale]